MDDFFPVRTDESMPENTFRFEHPDGRMDSFMFIDGEVLPILLIKLDDSPNWACPICSFVNEQGATACECCGISET